MKQSPMQNPRKLHFIRRKLCVNDICQIKKPQREGNIKWWEKTFQKPQMTLSDVDFVQMTTGIKLPNTSFMSADCLRNSFKSSTILIVSSINWYFDYRSQFNHNEISPNGKYLR